MEASLLASGSGCGYGCGTTKDDTPSSSNSFRLRRPNLSSLRLRRMFEVFDNNGDAMITVTEISQALSLLGLAADLSELDSLIRSYMKPGNEGLEYEDFMALHESLVEEEEEEEEEEERKAGQEEEELTEAFKVFDEDGDGYISARELQVVLGKLGFAEAKEIDRVQKMIISVDRNQDGRVDFFEFKDMMRNSLTIPTS